MIIVLMGASGSGKSTWVRNNTNGTEYIYCLDEIRLGYEMDINSFANAKRSQAIRAVKEGKWLIADATHLIKAHRDLWRSVATQFNLTTKLIALDTQLPLLLQAQESRSNPVPSKVVINGYKQFQMAKRIIHLEGWDEIEIIQR